MRLSRIRLLSPVLLLIIGLALGLLIYHLFTREEKKPEITTEELQMKISQRLRLITEEINYRTDVHLYEAGQHAEGTADLVVYVKYDLEHLQLSSSHDTIYVSLPEAELELGRRPGGDHSVRYYLDRAECRQRGDPTSGEADPSRSRGRDPIQPSLPSSCSEASRRPASALPLRPCPTAYYHRLG